ANQPRLQMALDCGDDGIRLVVIVRGADAVETGLVGDDLHEHPAVVGAAAGLDDLDVFDLERRQAVGTASDLLRDGDRHSRYGEQTLGEHASIHGGGSPGGEHQVNARHDRLANLPLQLSRTGG